MLEDFEGFFDVPAGMVQLAECLSRIGIRVGQRGRQNFEVARGQDDLNQAQSFVGQQEADDLGLATGRSRYGQGDDRVRLARAQKTFNR